MVERPPLETVAPLIGADVPLSVTVPEIVPGWMFADDPIRIQDATDGTPAEFFTMSM